MVSQGRHQSESIDHAGAAAAWTANSRYAAGAFALILLLTAGVYWSGLRGPFLFDDFATLPALTNIGAVQDLQSFFLFLISGITGPTGRPLSLLTFVANASGWPDHPWIFKFTNLVVHLINGWLLYAVLLKLARIRGLPGAAWIAVLGAGAWLIHPLWVSTTLYVVQRMTLLATLFILLGVLCYVHGRALLAVNPRRGYVWMTIATTVCPLLAALSKETGALLPLLLLVVEATALRTLQPRPAVAWRLVFLVLPLLLVAAALALQWPVLSETYRQRPFGPLDRLFTESRMLIEYLYELVIPRSRYPGLFNDDITMSTGLMAPPTTALSLLLVVALLAAAWWLRRLLPWLSLAILFFFAGHVLESTIIPLEIYFEHRNYMPSVFLFAAPIACAFSVPQWSRFAIPAVLAWMVFAAIMTYQAASLWSNPLQLAAAWVDQHPNSVRAHRTLTVTLESVGHPDLALQHIARARAALPQNGELHLQELLLLCRFNRMGPDAVQATADALRSQPFDFRAFSMVDELAQRIFTGNCGEGTLPAIEQIADALAMNPAAQAKDAQARLYQLRGQILAARGQGTEALAAFKQSLALVPSVDDAFFQVGMLANRGLLDEALQHLTSVEILLSLPPDGWAPRAKRALLNYPAQVQVLRQALEQARLRTNENR